jgi:hypothetical protein
MEKSSFYAFSKNGTRFLLLRFFLAPLLMKETKSGGIFVRPTSSVSWSVLFVLATGLAATCIAPRSGGHM